MSFFSWLLRLVAISEIISRRVRQLWVSIPPESGHCQCHLPHILLYIQIFLELQFSYDSFAYNVAVVPLHSSVRNGAYHPRPFLNMTTTLHESWLRPCSHAHRISSHSSANNYSLFSSLSMTIKIHMVSLATRACNFPVDPEIQLSWLLLLNHEFSSPN